MTSKSGDTPSQRGRLFGKIALIIGAGTGIGESAARIFASEGARVALADIQFDAVASVASLISQGGGTAKAFTVDE